MSSRDFESQEGRSSVFYSSLFQFEGNQIAVRLAPGLVIHFDEPVRPSAGELVGTKNDQRFVILRAKSHFFVARRDEKQGHGRMAAIHAEKFGFEIVNRTLIRWRRRGRTIA